MKLSHLLAGAALAALTAGAASAQVLDVTDVDATAPSATEVQYPATSQVTFADVLDLSTAISSADLEIQVDLSTGTSAAEAAALGALGATDELNITVNLSGAEFARGIGDGDFEGNDVNCAMVVSGGGTGGGTSVTFTNTAGSAPADCIDAATDVEFNLPIDLTAQEASFSIVATDANGTALASEDYDGSSTLLGDQPYVTTIDADDFTVSAANLTVLAGANGVPFDNAAQRQVYGITVDAITGALADFDTGVPAQFDYADYLGSGTLSISLANTSSFVDATPPATAGIEFDGSASTAAIISASATTTADIGSGGELAAGDFDNNDVINIDLVPDAADSGTAIDAQLVNGELSLAANATTGFLGETVSLSGAEIIRTSTGAAGTFDWVGDAGAVTRNVFRCTGVDDAASAFVDVTNSSKGLNGTYEVAITPENGEVILNNTSIGAVAGAFERGSVEITFSPGGASCARLLVGNNGTLSELD